MIEWRFSPEDVARIRFAVSPLAELVRSLIVLRTPARHWIHLPWIQTTRPRLTGLDLTEIFALVPVQGDTADFLTPPPIAPLPDLTQELDAVRNTPADRVVTEAADLLGMAAPIFQRIRQDPVSAAHRIADTLQAYWDRALARQWPRIRSMLEADVLWRTRHLAVGGTQALLQDLHDSVTWHGDRLSADDPHHHAGFLSGQGLLLTPSTMSWPVVRKMIEPYQPTITYPVRGVATLWQPAAAPAPDALAALIGRTRAELLIALAEPISTTALADRLCITPSAVSQHLSVLLDCGLVNRSRVGRYVLYQRTPASNTLSPFQPE
jgi:hypothetical protein